MLRHITAAIVAATVVACTDAGGKIPPARSADSLLIAPEDLLVVGTDPSSAGPSITGSIQPARRADLRAEVSAVVVQVLKENGDAVRHGDLLVRLDDTSIRDALGSSEAAERSAAQIYAQTQRQFARLAKLRESGLVSAPEVEDAEARRSNAQSDLEAARTRTVSARQQLARTLVRAPFDGLVSERHVSTGDTAQIGKELLMVVDPHSMRFEGRVSADGVGQIQPEQRVLFRVHGGSDREFSGTITGIDPIADPTSRQIEVMVAFDAASDLPRLAGLYAEGRIQTRSSTIAAVPANALTRVGAEIFAWRIENNALHRVPLELGERDARTGEWPVKHGLSPGARILRYPTLALRDGQKVTLTASP